MLLPSQYGPPGLCQSCSLALDCFSLSHRVLLLSCPSFWPHPALLPSCNICWGLCPIPQLPQTARLCFWMLTLPCAPPPQARKFLGPQCLVRKCLQRPDVHGLRTRKIGLSPASPRLSFAVSPLTLWKMETFQSRGRGSKGQRARTLSLAWQLPSMPLGSQTAIERAS